MQKAGLEVLPYESASHAVRFLQQQPWSWYPAAIITDLVMDGMGGYQLIRRVQDLYPGRNIPIMVISRLRSSLDVSEAEIAGAIAYMLKPVSKEALYETLRTVLNREKQKMLVVTPEPARKRKIAAAK